MQTDHTIDTVGKFCPVPIIEAANTMRSMKTGESLTVVADDEGIRNDMRNWCKMTGNEFLGEDEADGEISVYIRKTAE